MRDQGLQEAIRAVGGVSELARRIGISQPSVSNWDRIPAERVLSVEAATGVARAVLRPDLFSGRPVQSVDEVDAARAQEYALLSTLLARSPDAQLLGRLAGLRGDPSPLGIAHAALGEAAARADVERVGREYFDLFVGLGRGELLPYGSYYLTGFLTSARWRGCAAISSVWASSRPKGSPSPRITPRSFARSWPALPAASIEAPPGADREIFEKHMAPWIGRFFADLERSQTADFYARVGALGRTFMEIETEAFALPP